MDSKKNKQEKKIKAMMNALRKTKVKVYSITRVQAVLDLVGREGITEEVTFEPRPECK